MDLKNQHLITIGVFPFENLTNAEDLDIFCRSFCIELITELSKFSQFQIIAYPSVEGLAYEKLSKDIFHNHLKSDYFVQGSFRVEKNNPRINAQLYNSNSHRLIWGNRFKGATSNYCWLFLLQ